MPVTQAIFDKKNILVVGGAGFIGSHLCDELVKNNKVICVDNFLTGSENNIAHLLQNPNFRFINHDVINPLTPEALPELEVFRVQFQGIQEIYFLASPASPQAYAKFPVETLLANSVGLRNILDLAVKYKSQFLFASSPVVYGQGDGSLINENYVGLVNHLDARSCFVEAKRFGETLTANYRKKYDIDARIARIFNTYGPRMLLNDGRMIPEMIKAAMNNRDVIAYGSPKELISLFYVDDLIRAMVKFLESNESGPMNIGSDWKVTLEEVAQKIITLTSSSSKIVYQGKLENFGQQILPSITLVKEKIGWFPIVLLDEGLKKTIDYLSAQQGIREVPV